MDRRSFLQMSAVTAVSFGLPSAALAAAKRSKSTANNIRQIVLDTETTGNDPMQGHRIFEVACVELVDRKETGRRFHQFINPEHELGPYVQQMTGLTTNFLQNKPRFAEIAPALLEFIGGAELIIHYTPFDTSFLNKELELAGLPALCNYCSGVVNIWELAGKLKPNRFNYYGMAALIYRYNIDTYTSYRLSSALDTATLLAEIYLAMTKDQATSAL